MDIAIKNGFYPKGTLKLFVGVDPLPENLKGQFDISVATGCFLSNHFTKEAFDTMYETLKVGGLLIFSCRSIYLEESNEMRYVEKLNSMKAEGKLEEIKNVSYLKFDKKGNTDKDKVVHKMCHETPANIIVLKKIK